jgi:hypothetical protein
MQENQSEVARLLERIDQETISMRQGLTMFAQSARHQIIEHKFDALGSVIDAFASKVTDGQVEGGCSK